MIPTAALIEHLSPGAIVLESSELAGGVSAVTQRVVYRDAQGLEGRVVLRAHQRGGAFRGGEPSRNEFRTLQLLHGRGLRVPRAIAAFEQFSAECPSVLVLKCIDGRPHADGDDGAGLVEQMAEELARIHRTPFTAEELAHLAPIGAQYPRALLDGPKYDGARMRRGGDVLAHLRAGWPPPPANAPVLLHGDFWPGNVLWSGRGLTAVIDWEDAATGDPAADVAQALIEIRWDFGRAAERAFLETYRSANPIDETALRDWSLMVALTQSTDLLSWNLAAEKEARFLRELDEIVDGLLPRGR